MVFEGISTEGLRWLRKKGERTEGQGGEGKMGGINEVVKVIVE